MRIDRLGCSRGGHRGRHRHRPPTHLGSPRGAHGGGRRAGAPGATHDGFTPQAV